MSVTMSAAASSPSPPPRRSAAAAQQEAAGPIWHAGGYRAGAPASIQLLSYRRGPARAASPRDRGPAAPGGGVRSVYRADSAISVLNREGVLEDPGRPHRPAHARTGPRPHQRRRLRPHGAACGSSISAISPGQRLTLAGWPVDATSRLPSPGWTGHAGGARPAAPPHRLRPPPA
jgi:hypothetical protein